MHRIFGSIEGISEGHLFLSRLELSESAVHRPLQAGISGSEREGADSIVLSGGYEDDEDMGDVIIYTGHGGRDPKTSQQISDQLLRNQNLALAKSCVSGQPVRVIRGHSHRSQYSPKFGYRYDGLYRVESYWRSRGRSGHIVWRFRLVKLQIAEQILEAKPPSQIRLSSLHEKGEEYSVTQRSATTVQRLVRNTPNSQHIKELYDYRCQVCGIRLETTAGPYAEASHIQPLGTPHNGPDVPENMLCLCPNHHVLFDYGAFCIMEDLTLRGLPGKLTVVAGHKIDPSFLRYHRAHFYESI